MKKIFYLLMLVVLISGCGSEEKTSVNKKSDSAKGLKPAQVQQKIPEPYTKALVSLNEGDFDLASKYLDLTVQDFKDSEYVFHAYFLKSLIERSLFETHSVLGGELNKGIERGKALFSQDDVDRLKKIFASQLKESEKVTSDYLAVVTEVDRRYSLDKQGLTFNLKPINENPNRETSIVSNFGNNGYPVPTESDVEVFKNYLRIKTYNMFLTDVIKDGKVSYPEYLYYSAIHLIDKPVATNMLNKVVEITKNDKYNEMRIKAIEALKKSPKVK